MSDTRPVFGYIRVSSGQQAVDRQEANIPAAHKRLPDGLADCDLELFDDPGVSAFSGKHRPGFEVMLARIRNGEASALLIDTSSRLTRQGVREALSILWQLEDVRTRLFTTQGREYSFDIAGIINLTIDAERDHGYSRDLGHNTATGIAAIARRGFWPYGPSPYGYDAEGEPRARVLIRNEDASTVVRLFEDFAAGASIQALAKTSGLGRERVKKLLRNEAYCGTVVHADERHDGRHEALLTRELFDAAQARLRRNAAEQPSYTLQNPYGFLLRCDACGYGCYLHVSNRSRQLAYYRCERDGCGKYSVAAEYVNASFVLGLAALTFLLHESLDDPEWSVLRPDAQRRRATEDALAQLDAEETSLLHLLGEGIAVGKVRPRLEAIPSERDALAQALRRLSGNGSQRAELEALRDRLNAIEAPTNSDDYGVFFTLAWGSMSFEQRKSLLRELVESIRLGQESMLITFKAGLQVPVPTVSGRRKADLSQPLLDLGLGLSGAVPPSGFTVSSGGARVGAGTVANA